MNISIFGLGYVGCVSIGCLSQNGHKVIGVDIMPSKINLINNGRPTIIEKDIDKLIAENWKNGRISATRDFKQAVADTDVSIICVGTPSTNNGHLNLGAIYGTAEQIGSALKEKDGFHVVAVRSTVLPGTNQKVGEIIAEASGKKRNVDFAVVSNPEFLREGSAVKDYYNPPVTVIGTDNSKAAQIMREVYASIDAPVQEVEIKVAELIKYVNNAFHALKITFGNEVGNICKELGIDSHKLMNLFCMDHQLNLSSYYLKPGFAYGGSCLPKDLKALDTLAHDFYLKSPVISSISASNEYQKKRAFELVTGKGKKKVGILGLSFKAGTDDLRYSPVVDLAENLLGKGYSLQIYDQNVNLSRLTGTNKEFIDARIPHLSDLISDDLGHVVGNSELIIIAHKEPQFECLSSDYPEKTFIDLVKIRPEIKDGNYEGICW